MQMTVLLCGMALMALAAMAGEPEAPAPKDARIFEMRTYYAAPGKLDALLARFRDHTLKLFEKHGMTNIGYWVPAENPDGRLVYLMAYPDRETQQKAWKDFWVDPEWKAVVAESEKDGKLVAKIEFVLLKATDFSPVVTPAAAPEARTFELRVYKATPGRLPNLLARFREHTLALFTKHGMTNIGYWTPLDKEQGADDTLIYLLAHKSAAACAESFKTFRVDPAWEAAKKASEEKAGGSLTVPDGVKSTLLTPTDFSPMK
jgi:hypothetical protein